MALKDILVLVDRLNSTPARIDVATQLASRFGAHLTGLHVTVPPMIPSAVRAEMPAQAIEGYARFQADVAETAKALFLARARHPGVTVEWRHREGDPGEIATLHARYADLAVVGQDDPDVGEFDTPRGIAERILLGAGRPVLIVPYVGAPRAVGEHVVIAWNASREATRATNDALDLLVRAAKVTVLAINPRGGPTGHGDVPGADIALHLARHGVKAEAMSVESDDVRAAEMLLSVLADLGADLLVMGGYGRSRVRELVLGGVTRDILRSMTTPVLMSH
jgi:nucleotide-binding universal stress UspA family protein